MIGIVTVLACLAGCCAYIITAAEMSHHFSSPHRPRLEALRAGACAGVFFEALGLLLVWTLPLLIA